MSRERKLIAELVELHDQNTCTHENLKRGGCIWTICEDCGEQWADDRGGFKPYKDPKAIDEARRYLDTRWVNIYADGQVGLPSTSRQIADEVAKTMRDKDWKRIACLKVIPK